MLLPSEMLNKLFRSSFFICTLLFVFSAPSQAQKASPFSPDSAQYLWPTNASHALSGTFAETRSQHFHAALDIKTWGRRGYPVYATRDGQLHRMAIGPTGYGKVLYLRHDDGSYSLYAHLLRFNDQLQQIADSIRFSDYSSSFDVVLDSMEIHFEKGEQIALSGASGIGPPHLHFELRTPDHEPFNPLLTNLKIEDNIPPSFSDLAVIPLDISTKIEGTNQIYRNAPNRRSGYTDYGTIDVSGPVGLAADMFDQANDVPNVYAVYTSKLWVNGNEVFSSQADQFSYEKTDQMHLDRVYTLLETTGRGFQRLYVEDGNTLPFYQTSGSGGRLDLPPGSHQIRIKATDYFGNSREARLTLRVASQKAEPGLSRHMYSSPSSTDQVDPNSWTWFNDWVNIPIDDFYQLTLTPLINFTRQNIYYQNGETVSVNLATSPQFYFRTSAQDYFISRRTYPADPTFLMAPEMQAYASFPEQTFYDTTSVALTTQFFTQDSIGIHIFPDKNPIRKEYKLSVRLDSVQMADSTLSFYKTYPGSDYLSKLNTQRNNSYLTAFPSTLGWYMILPDHQSPIVREPRIVRSPDGIWLVYIPAFDRRAGIDYERTKLFVNGARGITEYEPEDGRLVYYHPDFQPESTNQVWVITYDQVGNRTDRKFTISR